MRKEGPTKAAKRTKARKEKAGAAASRKLACLCLKEENGNYVEDGAAAADLIGNFFEGLYGSPDRETYGEAGREGGGREEWDEWRSIFATEKIMEGISKMKTGTSADKYGICAEVLAYLDKEACGYIGAAFVRRATGGGTRNRGLL